MINNRIKYLFLMVLLACTEDSALDGEPDIQKPQISMLASSPLATEGMICEVREANVITVQTGNDIVLNLQFSDDRNLSQYKVDVHNNFDCHSHGRVAAPTWQLLIIENITSRKAKVDEVLSVPEDALAGDYHLQILCLDESGNEAEPMIYSIKVENSIDNIPPSLVLSEPVADSVPVVAIGADFSFKGNVIDNHSLSTGKIEITYTDPGGTEFFPIQEFFEARQGKEAAFDLKFKVPTSAVAGEHQFRIIAYDTYNNATAKEIEITFE